MLKVINLQRNRIGHVGVQYLVAVLRHMPVKDFSPLYLYTFIFYTGN